MPRGKIISGQKVVFMFSEGIRTWPDLVVLPIVVESRYARRHARRQPLTASLSPGVETNCPAETP
jgi:hypothetical protein